jgi:hypothetical protein
MHGHMNVKFVVECGIVTDSVKQYVMVYFTHCELIL